jgi:hypothetical protein
MGTESDYGPSLSVALVTAGPLAVIVHRIDDPAVVRLVTNMAIGQSTAAAEREARAGHSLNAAAGFARGFLLRRSLSEGVRP